MNAKWLSRAHGVGDALSADEQEAAWKSGETGFLPLGKTPQDAASQQNASEVDASQVVYAREMTEFLVWDSGSALRHTPRFSVACIPTTYQCSSTDMLIYVGVVLSQGGKLVKNVICDNAGNHRLVKAFLLGQAHGLDPDFVRKLPFWSEITWRSLPDSPLPRFPFRMAVVADEVVCPWTGTVHLQKNLVGNIRSPCRSICFGNLTVDPSGSLDLFLPPGSFIGYDPTSDKESASFLNPYHLIIDMVDSIEAVKIPWCLRGQLLLNLTGCLAVSSVLHRSLTTAQRLENSFTAFILLDLGNMLAGETAAEHNVSKAQCWLHPATYNHLQQLCGCTAIACYSYPDALPFKPWESIELKLEEYFGSLRCQYKSSQLTARDYALASCRQMRKHLQHCTELQEGKVPPTSSKRSLPVPDSPDYKAVNDEQYQKCALRALEGAFALMACCSKYCPEELSARYAAYCASRKFQNLTVEDNEAHEAYDDPEMDFVDESEEPPAFRKQPGESGAGAEKDDHQEDLSESDKHCLQLLEQLKAREEADSAQWDLPSDSLGKPESELQRLGCGSTLPPPTLDATSWSEMEKADASELAGKAGCNGEDDQPGVEKDNKKNTSVISSRQKLLRSKTVADVFDALTFADQLDNIEPVLGPLWFLLTALRCPADHRFLPNPQGCRVRKKKLNWQQLCEREAALIRQQTGVSGKRSGTFTF